MNLRRMPRPVLYVLSVLSITGGILAIYQPTARASSTACNCTIGNASDCGDQAQCLEDFNCPSDPWPLGKCVPNSEASK
jgi:hypothetical protein